MKEDAKREGVFAPYTDIPANLFFKRGGPTDTLGYYELPLPEGRKKYRKTTPVQFEESAPALAWWNAREEGPHAWKVDFAAKCATAVEAATSHWQRAESERNAAIALGKFLRELELMRNFYLCWPIEQIYQTVSDLEDALAEKTRQVEAHLDAVECDSTALLLSLHHKLANGRTVSLSDVIDLYEPVEPVLPAATYPQLGVRGFGGGLFAKAAIKGTETAYKSFNRLYTGAIVLSQVKGWEGVIAPRSFSTLRYRCQYWPVR